MDFRWAPLQTPLGELTAFFLSTSCIRGTTSNGMAGEDGREGQGIEREREGRGEGEVRGGERMEGEGPGPKYFGLEPPLMWA